MKLPVTRLHVVSPLNDVHVSTPPEGRLRSDDLAEKDGVRAGFEQLMEHQTGVVPDDLAILSWAWPSNQPTPSDVALRATIEALLASGNLRRIYLGTEPHLTFSLREKQHLPEEATPPRHSMQVAKQPTELTSHTSTDASPWSLSVQAFELQVEMDVEQERILLFRVLATVSFVGLLVLFRESTLLLLGL